MTDDATKDFDQRLRAVMTPAQRIALAQAKRDSLRTEFSEKHAEQQATDIEALVELEIEHGFDRVKRIDIECWKADVGAATMVVVRVPNGSDKVFKRFEQTVSKAKAGTTSHLDSSHVLAESCIVYPSKADKALYDATFEIAPGMMSYLAVEIVKAAQGSADEEKKG